jgi:hypothetical protein
MRISNENNLHLELSVSRVIPAFKGDHAEIKVLVIPVGGFVAVGLWRRQRRRRIQRFRHERGGPARTRDFQGRQPVGLGADVVRQLP